MSSLRKEAEEIKEVIVCNVCRKVHRCLPGKPYARCSSCGLVTMTIPPKYGIYNHEYSKRYRELQDTHNGMLMNRFRAQYVDHFLNRPDQLYLGHSLFDIGCGCGDFLRVMQRMHYGIKGCEINEAYREFTDQVLEEDNIVYGKFEDMDGLDKSYYSVITAFDVLEHTTDPRAVVEKIQGMLKPSGILVLTVPDVNSWNPEWPLEQYRHYKPGEHLFFFGGNSLEVLLGECGFKVVHTCWFEDGFRKSKELANNIKSVVAERIR